MKCSLPLQIDFISKFIAGVSMLDTLLKISKARIQKPLTYYNPSVASTSCKPAKRVFANLTGKVYEPALLSLLHRIAKEPECIQVWSLNTYLIHFLLGLRVGLLVQEVNWFGTYYLKKLTFSHCIWWISFKLFISDYIICSTINFLILSRFRLFSVIWGALFIFWALATLSVLRCHLTMALESLTFLS